MLPSNKIKGLCLYTLSLGVSSLNDVLFKWLGQSLPPVQVTCLRFVFATLLLWALAQYKTYSLNSQHVRVHLFRGVLLFSGMYLWCHGLTQIGLTDAIIINFTIPVITMLLATAFLGEKLTRHRTLATACGFTGVLCMSQPNLTGVLALKPIGSLLLAAVFFASSDILNKIYSQKESTIVMLFYTALATSLIGAPGAIAHWVSPTYYEWSLLALLGLGANLLLLFLITAYQYVEITATAPLRYLELIFSAVCGYVFFQEIPSSSTYIGALLIVPAAVILLIQEAQQGQKECENC